MFKPLIPSAIEELEGKRFRIQAKLDQDFINEFEKHKADVQAGVIEDKPFMLTVYGKPRPVAAILVTKNKGTEKLVALKDHKNGKIFKGDPLMNIFTQTVNPEGQVGYTVEAPTV